MDTATEIGLEIRALSAHYPRRRLSGAELDRWITDYVGDLIAAGWSGPDSRIACAIWRVSDAKKMPSPGELKAKFQGANPFTRREPALPAPSEPVIRTPENLRVLGMIAALANDMRGGKRKRLERLVGETPAEQAERLWPSHRADRVHADR